MVIYWATGEAADAALSRMTLQNQVQPVSRSQLVGLGGVMAVFQLESTARAAEFRARTALEFPAATIDFNTLYRPLQQQGMPRIYLPGKIDWTKPDTAQARAALVRIGMVDGPVSFVPALDGVSLSRKSFLALGDIPASPVHATAIATLIAGRDLKSGFAGVAGPALLYSAEVMRSAGREDATSSAALVRALDWLLTQGVRVVNLSLGGPGDAVMAKAFARLGELAVVVVAAAGNGGAAAPPAYPAAYPSVLAVTATDAADNIYAGANHGDYIALAAPGVDVWVPDERSGHYVTGTSFSAAVITSAVALLLQRTPGLGARKTLAQLCRTARDLGTPGTDPVFGCGLVQIAAALADGRQ